VNITVQLGGHIFEAGIVHGETATSVCNITTTNTVFPVRTSLQAIEEPTTKKSCETHGKLLSVKNPAALQFLTETGAPGTYYRTPFKGT
jgi:hypothetical protein